MAQSELLLNTPRFQVVQKYQATPKGPLPRQIVVHRGAAVIVPVLDDGRVVLIRNFRVAVEQELIELPAGTLDEGEDPLASARRELTEETGYRARSVELLTSFFSSPGILTERMYLYLATGLEEGQAAPEEGEDIHLMPMTWEKALEMARDGRIQDAKTLTGLLYFGWFRKS